MIKLLCIATGGALGAAARHGVSAWIANTGPANFPWGTLCVNAVGSMLIGLLFGISELSPIPSTVRLLFAAGFLGAFTTFSTYSMQTLDLFRDKEPILALLNIGLNNALSLVLVFAAYFASRPIVASFR